jgi:signal transduction histidine kinase
MQASRDERLERSTTPRRRFETLRSGRWSVAALALMVSLLLGSVLIPARFTSRILGQLRESQGVIEPARRVESQLELTLAAESEALQEYLLTGDSVALSRYNRSRLGTDRQLTGLEDLAREMDGPTADRVAAVRLTVGEWRMKNPPSFNAHLSRAELTTVLRAEQDSRDAMLSTVATLEAHLAAEAAAGRDRVVLFEEHSLTINASLVLVALAAMFAVAGVVQRERRLSALLARRMDGEAALRQAAERLASAFSNDDVTQEVARSAITVLRARAAFVEQPADDSASSPQFVIRASAGVGAPCVGTTANCTDSVTEIALKGGEPMLVPQLSDAEHAWFAPGSILSDCSAIVVPLANSNGAIGALVALSSRSEAFSEEHLARARTYAHLIFLAYEKVRLLKEARDGQRALERVMNSRSRLMRGFSHDIKNPLGAADGHAELLTMGLYGQLSIEQRVSIERVRGSIQSALQLIDDLHELARAETGNLMLHLEPVLLCDLISATCSEFHAAATRKGLSLATQLEDDTLVAETDARRVRQIISNLVTNAIKYTAQGSIVLVMRRVEAPAEAWALIEVEDTGQGIREDQLRLLFQEFVRLDTVHHAGAGLGLAISQRLAEALGGRITAQSEVGRGSRFTLWLPMSGDQRSPTAPVTHAAADVS